MAWQIIFFISLFLILHSYVFFPIILKILSRNKKQNDNIYKESDEGLPLVTILLAVYNEELVIENKIKSTFDTNYPSKKIEFIIGSDASTDKTNEIIKTYQKKFANLRLVEFKGRSGKSKIINELAQLALYETLILTDANVFFRPDTIYQLIKHYKNPDISLIGGNIINAGLSIDGISYQEKTYISRENIMKYQEGIIWGTMAGAFGGCYSIMKNQYSPVPPKFFMDDFFITMSVLARNGKCINELNAICDEDVSNKMSEEFRRKVRISIGNFQNLFRFKRLLFPIFSGLSFCFLSHKVLRWFGPIFIVLIFTSNVFLFNLNYFFQITLFSQLVLISIPILDFLLKNLNIHIKIMRFITHFYSMNLALLIGFFRFLYGVESNIWQPTQRFQKIQSTK